MQPGEDQLPLPPVEAPAVEGRQLVVCLDGTDNQFGETNTNVVRIFQSLEQDPERVLAYYDPGVGTIWEEGTLAKTAQKIQMVLGLAFGLGVTRNVAQAYHFLMRHHAPGDRIFIFGFSRGALEARALAGLIHRCGLLHAHLPTLEPYAMRLFQTPGGYRVADQFKATFSRQVRVSFLGLWDTVTSMGNVWSPITWPNTATNRSVDRVAHAIAIDERRAFFRQNRWNRTEGQRCDEVWFSGVHSDVGGGYPASDGRLWAITLEWMLRHARDTGLRVDGDRLRTVLAACGPAPSPDYVSTQHDSMSAAWKLLELVPRLRKEQDASGRWRTRLLVPARRHGLRGRPRQLKPGERVHRSAVERFAAVAGYRPETLTGAGLTLDTALVFLATPDEDWLVPAQLVSTN